MSWVEPEFATKVLEALQGQLEFTGLLDYTSQLSARGHNPLANVLYQAWLTRNQTNFNHAVYFNLGVGLATEGDLEGAMDAYRHAIRLAPAFLQPHLNLGLSLERRGDREGALAEWLWVAQTAQAAVPDQKTLKVQALNHLGRALEDAGRYAEALDYLTQSLTVDPHQPDAIHHWVFLRERQCAWPVWADLGLVSPGAMRRSTSALAMLSLTDDPALQLEAARNFVKAKVQTDLPRLAPARAYGHDRIRIGYLSSDLCLHPVAMLTAELFELHDRKRFEVHGFCWSREDGSDLRQRVVRGMDHFHRIKDLGDEAAARLILEQEIDILVDLQGQTKGARPNILSYRPAPIQITYLGLPATTAFPFIDYVIADRFLIPEEHQPFYSEKPLYMPDVYQVSDRRRLCSPAPSRQGCGLPPDAFVYCSLNNNYKYTPEVFEVWMNILRAVPGSVLWLLGDNSWAQANLTKEAEARGVAADRLVFTGRVPPENYLARYGAADLFLDTFPFNAGTTANDALWMGLPVLTRAGRCFASRMAGALLTAAGLDQLITYNLEDYQEKAIELGRHPEQARQLAEELKRVRENGTLFDTPRFVRNLESAFADLVAALP